MNLFARTLGTLAIALSAAISSAQLWDSDIGAEIVPMRGDDTFAGPLTLPFQVPVYNRNFTQFWINNNGSVTFTRGLAAYTAYTFPNQNGHVIVAPFFADVDTTPAESGGVHYSVKQDWVTITWNGVGHYDRHTERKNRFQLILTNDGRAGFSYDTLEWTTGDLSGGIDGFGGSPAKGALDAGDGAHSATFWEGNTDEALSLIRGRTVWYDLQTLQPIGDNLPPGTTITVGPNQGSTTNADPVVFQWSGLDDTTPPEQLQFQHRIDGGTWSSFSTSRTVNLASLAEGQHVFEVRAKDNSGQIDPTPASRTFSIDRVPPTINLGTPNAGLIFAQIPWTTNEASTSQVEWGLTNAYGNTTALDSNLVTNHSVNVGGLVPNRTYHFRVRSKDAAGNEAVSADATFSTGIAPDLAVTQIDAASDLYTDSLFPLSWTVSNVSAGRVNGPWFDRVYLSADQVIDGNDRLLGEFIYTPGLEPNQSIFRSQLFSVPRSGIQSGDYYFIVQTDATNAVDEVGSEANNVMVRPVHIVRLPLPDLVVTNIQAPATAFSDQTITVQFTVKNIGLAQTSVSDWQDFVYLSGDEFPSGNADATYSWDLNPTYLDPGEEYSGSIDIHIPRGVFGQYRVVVWPDGNLVGDTIANGLTRPNAMLEESEANNFTTNRIINIQVPPLPDLKPTLVDAPSTAFAGQTMNLTFRVKNQGDTATLSTADWVDEVWLSTDLNLNPAIDKKVDTVPKSGAIPVNGEYSVVSRQINIPATIQGSWYVFVKSDATDRVWEKVESNNEGYDATPVNITGTPPDLQVTAVNAPPSGATGQPISISWTVRNASAFPTPSTVWIDSVYVSTDDVLDTQTDTFVQSFGHQGPLAPGTSYTENQSIVLPACSSSGTYYVFVFTDARNDVYEFSPNLNAEGNNVGNDAMTISADSADLRVSAVGVPGTINAGTTAPVTWTVRNHGNATTNVSGWTDSVFISRNADFSGATLVGTFFRGASLAPNATYQGNANVTIPATAEGQYYVFVTTDTGDAVEECDNETNNSANAATQVTITNQLPDLTVQNWQTPASALSGQTIGVEWTAINAGTFLANGSWNDKVHLSTDATLSGDDRLLTTQLAGGPLAIGATYSRSPQVTLPNVPPGSYQLLIVLDDGNFLFEGQRENNNVAARPLTVSAPNVDLIVPSVDAPATAFAGQSMNVAWTIRNSGTEGTFATRWTDYVILSRDQVLDPGDPAIGYLQHSGALAGGASYQAQLAVTVPGGTSGPHWVFIRTDWHNAVAETNEANNTGYDTGPVQISLPPPTDLVVDTVTIPATGIIGESATIQWVVRNVGTNTALGRWKDAVYLSPDQTWDIQDALIGRVDHVGDLAPGATYQGTLTADLPPVIPANYYVLVRTDVRNNVRESNEGNNKGASATRCALDVEELPLGQTRNGTLIPGKNKYYKTNTPAGETVRWTLDAQEGASTEMFLKFGQMASRSNYDYLYDRPFEADQVLLIDNTAAGMYGSLIASSAPASFHASASIVPFSILSVYPTTIGQGLVTLRVAGGRLSPNNTFRLRSRTNGSMIDSRTRSLNRSTGVRVSFDLTGAAKGEYDLVCLSGSQETVYSEPIILTDAVLTEPELEGPPSSSTRKGAFSANTFRLLNSSNVDYPFVYIALATSATSGDWRVSILGDSAASQTGATPISERPGMMIVAAGVAPGESVEFTVHTRLPASSSLASLYIQATPMVLSEDDYRVIVVNTFADQLRRLVLENPSLFTQQAGTIASDGIAAFRNFMWSLHKELGFVGYQDGTAPSLTSGFKSSYGFQADILSRVSVSHDTSSFLRNSLVFGRVPISLQEFIDPDEEDPEDSHVCYVWRRRCIRICYFLEATTGRACEPIITRCRRPCDDYVIGAPDPLGPPFICYNVGSNEVTRRWRVRYKCEHHNPPGDPNDKQSLIGFGTDAFAPLGFPWDYIVRFENVSSAAASASRISVTDPLDPNLDPTTFRLKEIAFGTVRIPIPENRAFYNARIQLGAEFGNLLCDVSAGLDLVTNMVTWTLEAIDPATGEPPNSALLGLLQPEDGSGRGQGYVTYTIQPREGTPTGTVISNNATIIFDTEEPITTNTVTNTVDGAAPISQVAPLAGNQESTSFDVTWSGEDDANGSGLASYDIYVSTNQGPYIPWLQATEETAATFQGEPGRSYRFYSRARDNAGNVEDAPATFDAETAVQLPRVVTGRVLFDGLAGPGPTQVTMRLRDIGAAEPFDTRVITLAADGSFTLPSESRQYELLVKDSNWLQQKLTVDARNGNVSGVNFLLLNGDVDGDNEVGINDYALFGNAYGRVFGEAGYDLRADLDRDGEIGIADYALLSANYGQGGDD